MLFSSRAPIFYPALQPIVQMFLSHGPVMVHCIAAESERLTKTASNIKRLNGFPRLSSSIFTSC
jgi:hypothetical protein